MIRVAGINKNDFVNGEGVSVSLFLQGCPFHCKGCHNPETWDPCKGELWEEENLIKEIKQAISENGIIRNFSILGGEPFDTIQKREFLIKLIKTLKNEWPPIKIVAWSGYTLKQLQKEYKMQEILDNIDYLIEGQFVLEERDITLKWRGSRNQNIIDMKNNYKRIL